MLVSGCMAVDLSIEFCGVRFQNPLVLASGILGVTAASMDNVVRHGAGGVTTKSLWLTEHIGHPNPTILTTEHFMINAVGVPDAGIEKAKEELAAYNAMKKAPIIANIIAGRKADYGQIAEEIAKLSPDILEVNISCPNVEDEFGKPFACSASDAAAVTREVKSRVKKIPVIVKLSPNVTSIVEIAKSVADAGADGFCALNTMGPGLAIDLETRMPILANRVGGVSGPAMKPIVLKVVCDLRKATGLPVIATGGMMTGADALEALMCGAQLVGVGTGVYYRGIDVFQKMVDEMTAWCEKHGVARLSDLIGTLKN